MWTGVHERRPDTASAQKDGAKKWPLRGAAKFREETPKKGGGFGSGGTAIPRCNNMMERWVPRKNQNTLCETFPPGKPRKIRLFLRLAAFPTRRWHFVRRSK